MKINREVLGNFKAEMSGTVLVPGEQEYEKERQAWNSDIEQHPALIAAVESAADIVSAVNFAREHNLPIAVQATGHGIAHPCDGGLLINTSRMKKIEIDPQKKTARVEPGAIWKDLNERAQTDGLAGLSGSAPNVGIVGYTLGGGVGWLGRKYGLAADSVLSIDIVTADGQQIRASEANNRELFWGLRGGGGNFGIVVSMEFALYPVSEIFGGRIFYPIEKAKEVFKNYRRWLEIIPNEITSTIWMMDLPDIPDLPERVRGKRMAMIGACYAGNAEEGAKLLKPIREFGSPAHDTFVPLRYTEAGTISDDPVAPQSLFGRMELLEELLDAAIETLVDAVEKHPELPLALLEIRHLGGAIARTDADANAVSHRGSPFLMHVQVMIKKSSAENDKLKKFVEFIIETMQPFETGGVSLNFLGDGDAGDERTRAAYSPEHYRRLVALKNEYDPKNLFRFNHNIHPSATENTMNSNEQTSHSE